MPVHIAVFMLIALLTSMGSNPYLPVSRDSGAIVWIAGGLLPSRVGRGDAPWVERSLLWRMDSYELRIKIKGTFGVSNYKPGAR